MCSRVTLEDGGSENVVTKKVLAVGMDNLFDSFKGVLKLKEAQKASIADDATESAKYTDEIATGKMETVPRGTIAMVA